MREASQDEIAKGQNRFNPEQLANAPGKVPCLPTLNSRNSKPDWWVWENRSPIRLETCHTETRSCSVVQWHSKLKLNKMAGNDTAVKGKPAISYIWKKLGLCSNEGGLRRRMGVWKEVFFYSTLLFRPVVIRLWNQPEPEQRNAWPLTSPHCIQRKAD